MPSAKKSGRVVLWFFGVVWLIAVIAAVLSSVVTIMVSRGAELESAFWPAVPFVGMYICGVALVFGFALAFIAIVRELIGVREANESMVEDLRRLLACQTQSQALLNQVNQNMLLSDAIKGIAFREKGRSVLLEAIHQDIRRERWGSANVLIDDLASRFGAQEEAEQLRKDMAGFQQASMAEKIDRSISHVESLWLIHRYDEAAHEIETLLSIYPENEKVIALVGKTDEHREKHKRELLARWQHAIEDNDVDQGVELLKLLDNYLSPTEAAALEESARGVFRAKLQKLGVRFSLFVTERRWMQALQVGKEIVNEFPNSRMAQEVRDRLSVLEQRCQE